MCEVDGSGCGVDRDDIKLKFTSHVTTQVPHRAMQIDLK